jgi:CO dehydrogenase maturation factor
MTKRDYLEYEIYASLSEGSRFDLVAMGRPEGPGCYCAVNHNLREVVDALSQNYRYVVIDNEAGMEHLSRRTTRDVQHLLITTDATPRGIVAAERIAALRHEINIGIEHAFLILNDLAGDEVSGPLRQRIDALDIPLLGTVPHSDELVELELSGRSLLELEDGSPVFRAVAAMMTQILCL